jgi:hypothetical protein
VPQGGLVSTYRLWRGCLGLITLVLLAACSSSPTPQSGASSTTRDPGQPATTAAQGVTADASRLNGVYRVEITDEDLRAGGVTDTEDLAENHGVYTWTLRDGAWHFECRAPNPQENPSDDGTYTVDGPRVTFVFPPGGPGTPTFTWRVEDDGIRFSTPQAADPIITVLITAHPWTRLR